jgi:DNA-binding response OmpR family regulator
MTFASPEELVRLLLRQSDRHPVRVIGAAELQPFDPRFIRSLRNLGILLEREDLRDDGGVIYQPVADALVVIDPETGAVERYDDALDIRVFDIEFQALCCAIREQSGLNGPTISAISTRVWRLGRYERNGRAAMICLVRRLREDTAQEIVDLVRGAIDSEEPVALISLGACDLPTTVARQLDGLRMTIANAVDLLNGASDRPFALDLGRIRVPTGPQSSEARLQIDRIGRRVIFDGIELCIEPRDFDAFALLAEEAVAAGGWVLRDSIAVALQSSTGRESNLEQVDRCINRLRTTFKKLAGAIDVPTKAFIETKPKVGYRLILASSEIAFTA